MRILKIFWTIRSESARGVGSLTARGLIETHLWRRSRSTKPRKSHLPRRGRLWWLMTKILATFMTQEWSSKRLIYHQGAKANMIRNHMMPSVEAKIAHKVQEVQFLCLEIVNCGNISHKFFRLITDNRRMVIIFTRWCFQGKPPKSGNKELARKETCILRRWRQMLIRSTQGKL